MLQTRRSFITGIAALIAAPAVVRASGVLMPIRPLPQVWVPCVVDFEISPGWLHTFSGEVLRAYEEAGQVAERIKLQPVDRIHDSVAFMAPPGLKVGRPLALQDFRGRRYPV